jgi:hypothetical protein
VSPTSHLFGVATLFSASPCSYALQMILRHVLTLALVASPALARQRKRIVSLAPDLVPDVLKPTPPATTLPPLPVETESATFSYDTVIKLGQPVAPVPPCVGSCWEVPSAGQATIEATYNVTRWLYGANQASLVPAATLAGSEAAYVHGNVTAVRLGPASNGTAFLVQPAALVNASRVDLSYAVYLDAGFDFAQGGTLPGLYGGPSGCVRRVLLFDRSGSTIPRSQSVDVDCFSVRPIFTSNGSLALNATSTAGLGYANTSMVLATAKWIDVRLAVQLETTGASDGHAEVYLDGWLAASLDATALRSMGSTSGLHARTKGFRRRQATGQTTWSGIRFEVALNGLVGHEESVYVEGLRVEVYGA